MPLVATGRKYESEVIAGISSYGDDTFTNFHKATVTVGHGSALSIDNIGVALIWVNGNSRFEVYDAQVIGSVTNSPLPKGNPICIAIGDQYGEGFNKADTDIGTANVEMTILHRGDATILVSGMEDGLTGTAWDPANLTTDQDEFLAQLELQRITTEAEADSVTPTYTS